jgi:S-formylglutathione hydrolase
MMLEVISEHACFDGVQGFYRHDSDIIGLPMQFSLYRPPQAKQGRVPLLIYLAGLTCNEETFMLKAGAQRYAAQYGMMLLAPDTSPRGAGVAGEQDSWDLGLGAGFYLDAVQEPWRAHYRMESYLVQELRHLVMQNFPVRSDQVGLMGHSMGGHGALVLALRHPELFQSVSALAPIAAAARSPWGKKAFAAYLGEDETAWLAHDASALMRNRQKPFPHGILIDQGLADKFLDAQLFPHLFEAACHTAGQPLQLRRHPGYDHGYFFVASFIEQHIAFHKRILSL